MRTWMALITTLCTTQLLVACKQEAPPSKPAPKLVTTFTVAPPLQTQVRRFPAKVEASTRVNLSFQVGGRIQHFPVTEGQNLKKGDLIVSLDPSTFNYNLNQNQAQYDFDKVQETRLKTLLGQGHISKVDYDKAVSAFRISKANLNQARKDLADSKLYAPFDGTIIKKYVKLYQQVKPNEQIVSFQDINHIDIRVTLPENIIARIKHRYKAPINVSFEAVPHKTFKAHVKEFSAEADPETQTYDAVLTMPAPKSINILPGMTASIELPISVSNATQAIYLIPVSAVFKSQSGDSAVWLLDTKKNTISKRPVTIGALQDGNVQIQNGLSKGDIIIRSGVHFLRAGETVKPTSTP